MKFQEFIKKIKHKYTLEEFGKIKIVRTCNPKTIEVDGIKIEIPNDSSYYFENDDLVSFIENEEPDIQSIKNTMNEGSNFEIENGRLTRKRI